MASVDYRCTAEIILDFTERTEFDWTITAVLKKLGEYLIKVELVLCIK